VQLCERYRPRQWSDLIGHDAVKATVDRLRASGGLAGRAYWITGPSGTGKTTVAKLIAAELSGPLGDLEIHARKLTTAKLAELVALTRFAPLGGKSWCFLVNEAHRLRKDAEGELLTLCDPPPPHVTWLFTTTTAGGLLFEGRGIDSEPFLSRCTPLHLSTQGLAEPFARQAKTVAHAEGLDGKPLAAYVRLVHSQHGNLRAVYQRIEAGDMLKKEG